MDLCLPEEAKNVFHITANEKERLRAPSSKINSVGLEVNAFRDALWRLVLAFVELYNFPSDCTPILFMMFFYSWVVYRPVNQCKISLMNNPKDLQNTHSSMYVVIARNATNNQASYSFPNRARELENGWSSRSIYTVENEQRAETKDAQGTWKPFIRRDPNIKRIILKGVRGSGWVKLRSSTIQSPHMPLSFTYFWPTIFVCNRSAHKGTVQSRCELIFCTSDTLESQHLECG